MDTTNAKKHSKLSWSVYLLIWPLLGHINIYVHIVCLPSIVFYIQRRLFFFMKNKDKKGENMLLVKADAC